MSMIRAMQATLELARERDYQFIEFEQPGVDYEHLVSMYNRVIAEPDQFSEGKLGRWLGYMQGVLVANDTCTLDEMKELNKRFEDG